MGLQKVAFNFMVERGGKLAKSLLCSKPIQKTINFKGLKYAPLEQDVLFSRYKSQIISYLKTDKPREYISDIDTIAVS